MAQLGQTPDSADKVLNSFRGVPHVVDVVCLQIHDGFPAVVATDNVFAGATRQSALYDPSDGGSMPLSTGAPPTYVVTAPTGTGKPASHISAWTGFEANEDAYPFAIGAISKPRTLADGDIVMIGSCPIAFAAVAQD